MTALIPEGPRARLGLHELGAMVRSPLLPAGLLVTGALLASSWTSHLAGTRLRWAPVQLAVASCLGLGLAAAVSIVVRQHDDRLDATWTATVPTPAWSRTSLLLLRAGPPALVAALCIVGVAVVADGTTASAALVGVAQGAALVAALAGLGALVGAVLPLRLAVLALCGLVAGSLVASRASPALSALVPWDARATVTVSSLVAPPDHLRHALTAAITAIGAMTTVVVLRRWGATAVGAAGLVAVLAYGGSVLAVRAELVEQPAAGAVARVVSGDAATDCTEAHGVEVCTIPALAVPDGERAETAEAVADLLAPLGVPAPRLLQSPVTAPPGTNLAGSGLAVPMPADGRVLLPVTGEDDRTRAALAGAAAAAVGLPTTPAAPWTPSSSTATWCTAGTDAAAVALYLLSSVDPVVAATVDGVVAADELVATGFRTTVLVGVVEVDTGAVLLAQELRLQPEEAVHALLRTHLPALRAGAAPLSARSSLAPEVRDLRSDVGPSPCP